MSRPLKVPIDDAKQIAAKHGLRQVIIVAWDGDATHVVTYGQSLEDCKQAAQGGNFVKKALGWPDDLCHATPERLK
jgi:hypothetical protein